MKSVSKITPKSTKFGSFYGCGKKSFENPAVTVCILADILNWNANFFFSFLSYAYAYCGNHIFLLDCKCRGESSVLMLAIPVADGDGGEKLSVILCFGNLFTRMIPKSKFEEHDFGRTGTTSTEKVELQEGPLEQFSHEMEPFLCKQGMPVRLNKGVIELVSDFVGCEEGKPLSPEASRILRLLGNKMATFRLHVICRWSPEDFEVLKEGLELSDIESS
ncbi:hypothetical protein MKW98_019320 [Papaver atlanticum]|uniref:Large ribosomal subunit protein uL10-like insertion domain-containing protein n=1 Tax=Papaver atlanticum TaxID=357466 RepID=A0AAD4XB87_9MAGN|nr:hypothetical protein MKW98_019320 [Papaver atlanticum]